MISKLDLGEPIDLGSDYEDEDEPAALTREDSIATVLSEASTIMLSEIETLESEARILGIKIKGRPPKYQRL